MRTAECHPTRKHAARGYCTPCYSAFRRRHHTGAGRLYKGSWGGALPDLIVDELAYGSATIRSLACLTERTESGIRRALLRLEVAGLVEGRTVGAHPAKLWSLTDAGWEKTYG